MRLSISPCVVRAVKCLLPYCLYIQPTTRVRRRITFLFGQTKSIGSIRRYSRMTTPLDASSVSFSPSINIECICVSHRRWWTTMVVCRRHAAWSIATFNDGFLANFVFPLGPLLLLSHLEQLSPTNAPPGGEDFEAQGQARATGTNGDVVAHWAVVATLWSQAFAGFLAGRTAGKVLGPAAANRVGLTVVVAVGVVGAALTHAWIGLAGLTGARFFWARTLGGFLTGAFCSGVLSLSPPCPRSSSCKRCGALPGSRHFSEISPHGGGGSGSGKRGFAGANSSTTTAVATAWRRADAWWHLGLVLGLLVGGLCYGRGFSGERVGAAGAGTGAEASDGGKGVSAAPWLQDKPAFVACAVACSLVLAVAVVAWRCTGGGSGSGSGSASRVAGREGGASSGGLFRRLRRRGTTAGKEERWGGVGKSGRRRDSPVVGSDLRSGLCRDPNDDADGADAPLLENMSIHKAGFSAAENDRGSDLETGSGREVPADGPVSSRYLTACNGDAAAAKKMMDETARWRAETGAERSLSTPQRTLSIIRECYPYYAHGRSKRGEVVIYEQTGKMQFGRLAEAGVSPFDMQMHYAFFNDFVFCKLLPDDAAQLMTVLDVGELRLATVKNNTVVAKYLAATAEVMQKHYPERQSRILVVNAPWWFAGIWKGVSGMLSSGTQAKLQIRGKNFLPTLLEHVDASQIPPEYGGSCPQGLGHSAEEKALRELAEGLGPTTLSSPSPSGGGVRNSSGSDGGIAVAGGSAVLGGGAIMDPNARRGGGGGDHEVADEVGTFGDFVGASGGGGSGGRASSSRESSASPPRPSSPRPRASSVASTAASEAAGGGASVGSGGDGNGDGHREMNENGGRGLAAPGGGRDGGGASGNAGAAGAAGIGVTKRLASVVRRLRGGGSAATRAYLGVENRFRYDTARRMWVMEGEAGGPGGNGRGRVNGGGSGAKESGGGGSGGCDSRKGARAKEDGTATAAGNYSDKDNSERNLIRAIQAAQQARGGTSSMFTSWPSGGLGGLGGLSGGGLVKLGGGGRGDNARTWRMDGPPGGGGGGGDSTAAAVLALQMVWAALEAASEAFLPLWMLSPGGHGLGFSAADTGVVLAIAAAALALPPRCCSLAVLLRAIARSPVRALRAATGVQIITATFLSGLATTAWAWVAPLSRDATFAAVAVAVAGSRTASAVLARPALGNLLNVALHVGGGGGGGGGGSSDGHHYYRRLRTADGAVLTVAAGASQSAGVLVMGAVFSRAVRAGADAGVVSFRLFAAAFVGVYLTTLLVHSSAGTGGGGAGAARARLRGELAGKVPWFGVCDVVEHAVVAATTVTSSPSPLLSSYSMAMVAGDHAVQQGGWVAAGGDINLAKES